MMLLPPHLRVYVTSVDGYVKDQFIQLTSGDKRIHAVLVDWDKSESFPGQYILTLSDAYIDGQPVPSTITKIDIIEIKETIQ